MEQSECLPLKVKIQSSHKKCPCKNKNVQQTNSYFSLSTVQNAVHWHEHMPSALAATDQWPCRWRSAWAQPKTATLSFCKVVWRRYLGKVGNFIVLCGQFIQDTACQFLSKSVKYCRSYNKKNLVGFYAPQCRMTSNEHSPKVSHKWQ